MKMIIHVLAIVSLSWILALFLPWWIFAIVCFAIAFVMKNSTLKSFWISALSILVFWFVYIYIVDLNNNSILSTQLAGMLQLPNQYLAIIISALMGALIAGFSGAAGSQLGRITKIKEPQNLNNELNTHIDELKDLRPDWKDTSHI